MHEPNDALAARAKAVITAHRDLRDVAGSVLQRGWASSEDAIVEFLLAAITQHRWWSERARLDVRFESMLEDRVAAAREVARAIGVETTPLQASDLVARVQALSYSPGVQSSDDRVGDNSYDRTTLLHRNHVTAGPPNVRRQLLNSRVISRIENVFGDWLEQNGYAVGRGMPDEAAAICNASQSK